MNVYIANFGRENWAWHECLERSSIAVMDEVELHEFWIISDKSGYIAKAQELFKKPDGQSIVKSTASRWYSLNDIMINTSNDIWIHRDNEYLWWTKSRSNLATRITMEDPKPIKQNVRIHVYFKECEKWSHLDGAGNKLIWNNLHPKARDFLFTEGTCQKLRLDNSQYALSLIAGEDLSSWHKRDDWHQKEKDRGFNEASLYGAQEIALYSMASAAVQACKQSGSQTLKTYKNKEFRFLSEKEMELYLKEIALEQGWRCALTNIPLEYDKLKQNSDFYPSLDRIDSDGHYEKGNLQIVCKFINKWKSDSDNEKFLSLLNDIINANSR